MLYRNLTFTLWWFSFIKTESQWTCMILHNRLTTEASYYRVKYGKISRVPQLFCEWKPLLPKLASIAARAASSLESMREWTHVVCVGRCELSQWQTPWILESTNKKAIVDSRLCPISTAFWWTPLNTCCLMPNWCRHPVNFVQNITSCLILAQWTMSWKRDAIQVPSQKNRAMATDIYNNHKQVSANANGPCDAVSCKINHIALPTEYNYQAMSVGRQ